MSPSANRDGPASVLSALRHGADQPQSGQNLAEQLGVSRAQVWKDVSVLRERGYRIEGTPGGGYQLADIPDRLFPEEVQRGLKTRWLGHMIDYFPEVDSTNRVALEAALAGAPHGQAVIAEAQSAGRGRLGRPFFSPPYQNLYVSIVLRPRLDTSAAATLLLAAGISVAETVSRLLDNAKGVEIKWPNDVLLDGRKTSGILMELGTEEARLSHAVLGIGVNLNVDPNLFPEEFRARATSLSQFSGARVDRLAFTRALFESLEATIEAHQENGWESLVPRFESFFQMTGREVTVQQIGGDALKGTVLGVQRSGALLIQNGSGQTVEVLAGDVTLSGPPPRERMRT
ncbi:MAG: biotin--[acetyl-CoA-carboxylase] ligase [bacterium TMED88]|nr:biotin--[acetyl-CoA-carboxylase] ligase [Deltaproteobacteria bacterium]OUV26822.1 MAG: biotin--[acetyl-CoA-carboxylase] ligase [bacterium TMED88]